jgi:uncharacterized protein YjbI with pentapeptide repeats
MTDETKTCQVEMLDSPVCGRPVLYPDRGDGKCILHTEEKNKCLDTFQIELDKTLGDTETECYDFTRVIFPANGCTFPKEFDKDVNFNLAKFLGSVSFNRSHFRGIADFEYAVFVGRSAFRGSRFDQAARFLGATFEGEADFRSGTFEKSAVFNEVTFKSGVDFTESKFRGEAYFTCCVFDRRASFSRVEFERVGSFVGARFHGRTDFDKALFGGECEFSFSMFAGEASFIRTHFTRDVSFLKCHLTDTARLTFDAETEDGLPGIMFQAEADFRSVRLDEGSKLTFRKVVLERSFFLETRVRDVEFVDVTWPRYERWSRRVLKRLRPFRLFFERTPFYSRMAAYDELWVGNRGDSLTGAQERPTKLLGKNHHMLLAQLYRQLQANYIREYRYTEAGDFYIGEQETMRKATGVLRQYLSSYFVYKWISFYGQRYLRSLSWLLFVLLLFPTIFLWGGIDLSPRIAPGAEAVDITKYEFSFSPEDCFLFTDHYLEAFKVNISFITLNRSEVTSRLPHAGQRALAGLEMVLVVILVSFVVLALRRQYKRKSF